MFVARYSIVSFCYVCRGLSFVRCLIWPTACLVCCCTWKIDYVRRCSRTGWGFSFGLKQFSMLFVDTFVFSFELAACSLFRSTPVEPNHCPNIEWQCGSTHADPNHRTSIVWSCGSTHADKTPSHNHWMIVWLNAYRSKSITKYWVIRWLDTCRTKRLNTPCNQPNQSLMPIALHYTTLHGAVLSYP